MSNTRIFISYRRDDSATMASKLEERLEKLQGGVFLDVSDIKTTERFPKRIREAIDDASYVIILIGKNWLNNLDEKGNRRLDNPSDYVRREIKYSLNRRLLRIIPVLVDGAKMPKVAELPNDLSTLAKINALPLRHNNFELDFHLLSKTIDELAESFQQEADDILDEVDMVADYKGGLSNIVSLKPTVARNPYLHDMPEYATWNCSITGYKGHSLIPGSNKLDYLFETKTSGLFEGEQLKPNKVKIEGQWRIGIRRDESLVMILTGNTFDGDSLKINIPIEEKSGERSYTGRDEFGNFYRLEWLRKIEEF